MAITALGIDHIHFEVRDLKRMRELLNRLFDNDMTPVGHLEPFGFYNSTMYLRGAVAGQPFLDMFQPAGLVGSNP